EVGEPVAGAYVAAVASAWRGSQQIDWRSDRAGPDGRFEITNIRGDIEHAIFARKQGYGTVTYEFARDEGDVELDDVVLPTPGAIRGVLVDEDERPIAKHRIELSGWNADRLARHDTKQDDLDSYVGRREAYTDDLGRFGFVDLAAGEYTIEARVYGLRTHVDQRVEVVAGETVEDVRLVLGGGLQIAGRVTGPGGVAVPTVWVRVEPEMAGTNADVMTRADGSFVARGLEEGTYTLRLWPTEASVVDGMHFAPSVREGVAAGSTDLVLTVPEAVALRGRVVDRLGEPVKGANVRAKDPSGTPLMGAYAGPDGRFVLYVAVGSFVDLEARPPAVDEEGERVRGTIVFDPDRVGRLQGVVAGGAEVKLQLPGP
ncbi:MAG: carboxypeptidase-like regulatory domain-containing protein, partial [Planctomycetota bacterium]|nr:carboxypeptidase-like regulatory domain-containing protein [Planctomycetota bacterium]